MTNVAPVTAEHLWATPHDALKLVLTGSVTGRLTSAQRDIYDRVLAKSKKPRAQSSTKNGASVRKENVVWPGVRVRERRVNEATNEVEIQCRIPDLVRYMLSVFKTWSMLLPPLDLDYLNQLTDEFGRHPFLYSNAPGQNDWQDSDGGLEHWKRVCEKQKVERKVVDLQKSHHAGDPRKLESQWRSQKELQEELQKAELALLAYRPPAAHPKTTTAKASLPWLQTARMLGQDFKREFPKLSTERIAKKINLVMTEQRITGPGGKVPTAETIRRHALTGLKK